MQPNLVRQPPQAASFWRALALGSTVAALMLTLYARQLPAPLPLSHGSRHQAAQTVAAPRSDKPARQSELSRSNTTNENAEGGALEALPVLVQRFENASNDQLSQTANALAVLGGPAARAVLRHAAESPRSAVRAAAFEALLTLDTPDVREFMLNALNQAEPLLATGYFVDCREPRALPALERLAHADPELSRAAIGALFAQGAPAEPAIERLLSESAELSDALLAAEPISAVSRRVLRRSSIARLTAGAHVSGPIYDFLEQDLSDDARAALEQAGADPASAERALNALSTRGDRASLAALGRLASDLNPRVAVRAACALVSQPDSRSQTLLLRPNRGALARETAAALLHINAPGARPI